MMKIDPNDLQKFSTFDEALLHFTQVWKIENPEPDPPKYQETPSTCGKVIDLTRLGNGFCFVRSNMPLEQIEIHFTSTSSKLSLSLLDVQLLISELAAASQLIESCQEQERINDINRSLHEDWVTSLREFEESFHELWNATPQAYTITLIQRQQTRNTGSPMWRCKIGATAVHVFLFDNTDPLKNNFDLVPTAIADRLTKMNVGDSLQMHQPIRVKILYIDGFWRIHSFIDQEIAQ